MSKFSCAKITNEAKNAKAVRTEKEHFFLQYQDVPYHQKKKCKILNFCVLNNCFISEEDDEIWNNYQSLLLILVGAVIGFLGSIGLEYVKGYRHKKELTNRILEELEINRTHVKDVINTDSFLNNVYFTDSFKNLKQELILKLNGKYYRAISETYQKIEGLYSPIEKNFGMSYAKEKNSAMHMEALNRIDETITLLKRWQNRRFFT